MKQKLRSILNLFPKKYHPWLRDVYRKGKYFLLLPLYRGDRFECPLCGGRFQRFLPTGLDLPLFQDNDIVGIGYRLNAVCPRCYSLDRDRLVYLYIKDRTELLKKKARLLHVAPEKNLQKIFKSCSNIDYLSVDLDSPLAMIHMNITDIEFKDNSFDVIICCHCLEHVPDDRKAMSELYRVLRPGGWAILQVPISLTLDQTYEDLSIVSRKEREKAFGQADHVRIYARDYQDRLERAGFAVNLYSFVKEFGKSAAERYGLLKREELYVCSKPRRVR